MSSVESLDETRRRELNAEWVRQWERVGPLLEQQRRRDIEAQDSVDVLAILGPAIDIAIHSQPPRMESGIAEMQRLFALAFGKPSTPPSDE